MSRFVTLCRGSTCMAKVLMTDEVTGRRHPWDYPVPACEPCGGTGEVTATIPADMIDPERTKREKCKPCRGRGKIYKSHYKTCANADEFRTPKDADA